MNVKDTVYSQKHFVPKTKTILSLLSEKFILYVQRTEETVLNDTLIKRKIALCTCTYILVFFLPLKYHILNNKTR